MEENIIQNHIATDLPYDILELYFTKIHITIEDAFAFELPKSLNRNKGLILFGRGPIWLYLILFKKIRDTNAAAWVAQYDTSTSTAVKFEEKSDESAIIRLEEFRHYLPSPQNQMVIAFIGPPHSGKTVFLYSLFNHLLARNPVYIHRNFYVIKGCPDGEAFWSFDLPPTLLKLIRDKREFTDEFTVEVMRQIKSISKLKKIIFVDCGGKIDERNKTILSNCTHAILVSSDPKKADEWKSEMQGIKYLAEISSYKNVQDKIAKIRKFDEESGTFFIDMIDLERGNTNVHIPEDFLQYFLNQ